jgi:hypothetical protein
MTGGRAIAPERLAEIAQPEVFTEPCRKCGGSGNFHSYSGRVVGACFTCKGTGTMTFKTSREARKASREGAAARKAKDVASWAAEHQAAYDWLLARRETSAFAVSVLEGLKKFGAPTDNQLAAIERSLAKEHAAKEQAAERQAAAPEVSTLKIEEAFAVAREKGIKRPVLRLDTFKFKPAGSASRNPGAIYVTEDGDYLGKIADGKFLCASAATPEQVARIQAAAADPEAAAIAYGRRTGNCCICARTLTKGESIDRGIGPICAERFGW